MQATFDDFDEPVKRSVHFEEEATARAAPSGTRYVPPHLRQKQPVASTSALPDEPVTAKSELVDIVEDPRLRRQIMGLLNKLSSTNIANILVSLTDIYTSHPRALVSTTLTSLLLEIISGRDNLGESFVITYAALVAAVGRGIGIEFTAGVIARAVGVFDEAHAKNVAARAGKNEGPAGSGFQGRPGSKECENIIAFLAELYNFSVVACVLVYDLVKMFIDTGLEELEVELLVKVVKRESFVEREGFNNVSDTWPSQDPDNNCDKMIRALSRRLFPSSSKRCRARIRPR